MKTIFLIGAAYLFPLCLPAQIPPGASTSPRQVTGVKPLHDAALAEGGQTVFAVVIGISDYQDPAIPDLRFAHKDASAFASWLQSPAGGNLPNNQIQLLLNEQATIGNMFSAIDWLADNCRENDRAIFYFSGHGDIETKTYNKEGFLLCYNTPPNNYRQGAYNIHYLRDAVQRITLEKKAGVVLIVDACRAGKLAGSQINGPQLTTAALQTQITNSVKILSCQANEYSLEGEQWGGGRGIFSFYFTRALYGLADKDANQQVTLAEIIRFVEDHVPTHAAPTPQNPVFEGDKTTILARVHEPTLTSMLSNGRPEVVPFAPIEIKGTEERTLAKVDSHIVQYYRAFWEALNRNELMTAREGRKSADECYEFLIQAADMAPLQNHLKRNFVAALLDESQQLLNGLLNTDPIILDFLGLGNYDYLPSYLKRAASLLGEKHYLYPTIKAREHYFRARLYNEKHFPELSTALRRQNALLQLDSALAFDPQAPFLYLQKGFLVFYIDNPWSRESSIEAMALFEKATELAPHWAMAAYYRGLANQRFVRLEGPKHRKEAIRWYKKAIEIDSTFLPPYRTLGEINNGYEEEDYWFGIVVEKFEDYIQTHPEKVPAYYYRTLGRAYHMLGRTKEAENALLKGNQVNGDNGSNVLLQSIYIHIGQYEKAEQMFRIALGPDSLTSTNMVEYLYRLRYFFMNAPAEPTIKAYRSILVRESRNPVVYEDMINVFLDNNQLDSAKVVLEEWIAQMGERSWLIAKYKGWIYTRMGLTEEARTCFEYLSGYADSLDYNLALRAHLRVITDFHLGRTEQLQAFLQEIKQRENLYPAAFFLIATALAYNGQDKEALAWMEMAFQKGYLPRDPINLRRSLFDPDLLFLRKTPEFKTLVNTYFPGLD